jgi:hypothetical protein
MTGCGGHHQIFESCNIKMKSISSNKLGILRKRGAHKTRSSDFEGWGYVVLIVIKPSNELMPTRICFRMARCELQTLISCDP